MTRHNGPSSYGHRVSYFPDWGGYYVILWQVDSYSAESRLRSKTVHRRDTDEKGARRFAKKWGLKWEDVKR